jgi:hypothetical protein
MHFYGYANDWSLKFVQPCSHHAVTMQPCNHATMQPCNHAAMQPCNHATMQPCSHATMQPCSRATMQPCNHATMQPCNLATMQPCNHATMQPCNHATMQPCNHATIKITSTMARFRYLLGCQTRGDNGRSQRSPSDGAIFKIGRKYGCMAAWLHGCPVMRSAMH